MNVAIKNGFKGLVRVGVIVTLGNLQLDMLICEDVVRKQSFETAE
jgi:hypothetical protein